MADIGHIKREDCRLCGSQNLAKVLELTPTPPANALISQEMLGQPQGSFPLDVYLCGGCGHVQLLNVLDAGDLFGEYLYVSGTSPVMVEHLRAYAEKMCVRQKLKPNDLVVEIGSNDGVLLGFFQNAGMRVLGVDPARNIAAKACASGIETKTGFFTSELSKEIRADYGPASVICANNVFAHIDDLTDVVRGMRHLLAPDGIIVFEVSYLLDVYEKTLFDTIYHEHLDYHHVGPLKEFFDKNGLALFDVERVSTQGGSIRCYVASAESGRKVSISVQALEELEQLAALDRPETYRKFADHIKKVGYELKEEIGRVRGEGKKVSGFGVPAKATTLLYHFGLGSDEIEYIVDDNPLKQGLYSSGKHIPILPTAALYDLRPEYVVILAWNFAENIISKHADYLKSGGKFIVPLPKVSIV